MSAKSAGSTAAWSVPAPRTRVRWAALVSAAIASAMGSGWIGSGIWVDVMLVPPLIPRSVDRSRLPQRPRRGGVRGVGEGRRRRIEGPRGGFGLLGWDGDLAQHVVDQPGHD